VTDSPNRAPNRTMSRPSTNKIRDRFLLIPPCPSTPLVENRRKKNTNKKTSMTPTTPRSRGKPAELRRLGSVGGGPTVGVAVGPGVGEPAMAVGVAPGVGEPAIAVGVAPDDDGLCPLSSIINIPEIVEEATEERTRATAPIMAALTVSLILLCGCGLACARFNAFASLFSVSLGVKGDFSASRHRDVHSSPPGHLECHSL